MPPRPPELDRRRLRPAAAEEKSSRWPAIALAAIIAVSGLGYWNKQRNARIEAQRAAEERDREAAEQARRERYVPRYATPLPSGVPQREPPAPAETTPPPAASTPSASPTANTASTPQAEAAREPATPEVTPEKVQRFRQMVEAEFRAADADGDGYISLQEARERMPILAKNFKRVDTDGNGRISFEEFLQAKRTLMERRFGK